MNSRARRTSLVLDLKRYDCFAVDFYAELRSDWMPSPGTGRKQRHPVGSQRVDVHTVQQRLPFHFTSRAIEYDDSASVLSALEDQQLMEQVFQRCEIGDSRFAEVGGLTFDKAQLADEDLGYKSRDVQVLGF